MTKYLIYEERIADRILICNTFDFEIYNEEINRCQEMKISYSVELVPMVKHKSLFGWRYIEKDRALDVAKTRYKGITTKYKNAKYINSLFEGISFTEKELENE